MRASWDPWYTGWKLFHKCPSHHFELWRNLSFCTSKWGLPGLIVFIFHNRTRDYCYPLMSAPQKHQDRPVNQVISSLFSLVSSVPLGISLCVPLQQHMKHIVNRLRSCTGGVSSAWTHLYSAHYPPPQTWINTKKVRSSGACHAAPTSPNHNVLEIFKKRTELVWQAQLQHSPKHGCCLPGVLLWWSWGASGQQDICTSLLPVKGFILGDAPFFHAVLENRHN